ncbi:MAG: Rrf2 family transcriptional regulator [Candidatus Neomarinimicrobiota bacterium]
MLLSQTAEYALRAMAWLAATSPEAPVRARDLSAATGIPPQYLSKILRRLVLAGLLASQKGRGGGFTLAYAPEEIRFVHILEAVDAYPAPGRCAFGWGACDGDQPCPLHGAWIEMSEALHSWATNTTLAEVRDDREMLARMSRIRGEKSPYGATGEADHE